MKLKIIKYLCIIFKIILVKEDDMGCLGGLSCKVLWETLQLKTDLNN